MHEKLITLTIQGNAHQVSNVQTVRVVGIQEGRSRWARKGKENFAASVGCKGVWSMSGIKIVKYDAKNSLQTLGHEVDGVSKGEENSLDFF